MKSSRDVQNNSPSKFCPKHEEIDDLLEEWEELRLVEKDFRKFCDLGKSYCSRSNFLRAFRNFLDKNLRKDPLENLTTEELIDTIHVQTATISQLQEDIETASLLTAQCSSEGHESTVVELPDVFMDHVRSANDILKDKWGQQWEQSFLRKFIMYLLDHAAHNIRDRPWNEDNKDDDVIRFLKTLQYLGGKNTLNFLRGKKLDRYAPKLFFNPSQQNLPLPSVSTLRKYEEHSSKPLTDPSQLDSLLNQYRMDFIGKHCVMKLDAIFLRKEIHFNSSTNKIEGIEGMNALSLEEFCAQLKEKGFDFLEGKSFVNQAMLFMLSSVDGSLSRPFFIYIFGKKAVASELTRIIVKHASDFHDKFTEHGIAVIAITGDGGEKGILRDFHNNKHPMIPIFDLDHFCKTIRNQLHAGRLSLDGLSLEWQILTQLFNSNLLPPDVHVRAIEPKNDKQCSLYMRSIFNVKVAAILQKDNLLPNESHQMRQKKKALSAFIEMCFKYMDCFESKTMTHADRWKSIEEATTFFLTRVKGLSAQAVSTFVINRSSWRRMISKLQKDSELSANLIWRTISTMEVENIFSMTRSKVSSPNSTEFKQILKKATEESAKAYQGSKIGYMPPQQSLKSLCYYRRETLDDFPTIRETTLPPLRKKIHNRKARGMQRRKSEMLQQLKMFNNRLNVKERTLRNTVAKKEFNSSALVPPQNAQITQFRAPIHPQQLQSVNLTSQNMSSSQTSPQRGPIHFVPTTPTKQVMAILFQ